jgi:hypothetical protein
MRTCHLHLHYGQALVHLGPPAASRVLRTTKCCRLSRIIVDVSCGKLQFRIEMRQYITLTIHSQQIYSLAFYMYGPSQIKVMSYFCLMYAFDELVLYTEYLSCCHDKTGSSDYYHFLNDVMGLFVKVHA